MSARNSGPSTKKRSSKYGGASKPRNWSDLSDQSLWKSMTIWNLRTEWAVLTVILEFLYGGRPEEAWKALGELWPSDDRERIRHTIINEYCGGLRSDLSLPLGPLCQAGSAGGAT